MWPFFARKKHQQNVTDIPPFHDESGKSRKTHASPMRFTQLVTGMGDFGDFRNHDAALKFWLPEAANEALEEMAGRSGLAMSELLRQLFATHCYGIYAYQVIIETIPGVFKDPEPPLFSLKPDKLPVGKKRVDTYWVPERIIVPVKLAQHEGQRWHELRDGFDGIIRKIYSEN